MKKILAILCGVTMMFAACTPDQTPEPSFPETATATVAAGEVYELAFSANLDWTLSISEEAMAYFAFLEADGVTTYSLQGVAGDYVVKVKVADTQEFDVERVCDITLSMGNQSQIICTLTRSMTERSIAVYAAAEYSSEADDFTKDENGAYIYSETDATALSLIYDAYNNIYKSRIKVVANCEYSLTTTPDWLTFSIVDEGNKEFQEYRVLSNTSKLPFETETKQIVFSDTTDPQNPILVKEMSASIPGCAGYLSVSLAKSMSFNAEGLYDHNGSYSEMGAIATIVAPMGAQVFKASKSAQGWYYAEAEATQWILLQNDEWEEGASATEGIWERRFNVLTAANDTNAAREGLLIILPQTLSAKISDPSFDLFNEEGTEVKAEYKEYAYTITQDAPEVKDMFSVVVQTDSMESMGAELTEAPAWTKDEVDAERGFKLLYTKEWSSDGYWLNANFEYDEIVYKGWNATGYNYTVVSGENSWLSYDVYAAGGKVTMDTTKAQFNADEQCYDGFIIFKKNGQDVTYLYCVYNENATVGGGGGAAGDVVAFANSEYAAMLGATLARIEAGNELYDNYFGADYGLTGLPQYALTYTSMMPWSMPSYAALAINGFAYGQATGEYEINGEKMYGYSLFSMFNDPDMGGVIIEPQVSPDMLPNGNYVFSILGMSGMPIARIVLVLNIPM